MNCPILQDLELHDFLLQFVPTTNNLKQCSDHSRSLIVVSRTWKLYITLQKGLGETLLVLHTLQCGVNI